MIHRTWVELPKNCAELQIFVSSTIHLSDCNKFLLKSIVATYFSPKESNMKRLFVTIVCLHIFANLHAQGITLLYKNNRGWNDSLSWMQINAPQGQTPIQRSPTLLDDVVISQSLSGISSVTFKTDTDRPDFNVGGSGSGSLNQCRSMHISNTEVSFFPANYMDNGATVNVYTSSGGFVILDSNANLHSGIFQLHGGNPAIADLEVINSTFGVLTDFTNYAGIYMDANSKARLVGSTFGGMDFGGGSLYAENSTINTDGFKLGDNSTDTILNSTIEDVGLCGCLTFLIGKNANFVSSNVTVKSNSNLAFGTSGSILNGNVSTLSYGGGNFTFLQEDPANPLPNIINGNLTVSENEALGFNGDVKISGDIIFHVIDQFHDGPSFVAPVVINGQHAFDVGGVFNYGGNSLSITGCANNYCHYKLELFGNTNSNISWPGGFPVDTLIINKTGCAKVTIDSSLYVSGATRIKSGQLVLNPNDDHPYKFVCAGNVDIAQGGGLFLRRDSAGVVANMAFGGTLVDHNSVKDSTCTGLSNPYNGIITTPQNQGITLLYHKDMGWNDSLSWIQINPPSGQTPIQRVPTENDDVVISYAISGIAAVNFETNGTNPDFNVGGSSANGPSRCRSMHVSNTRISIDNPSIVDGAPSVNVYTASGGFVVIDSGSNMLHGHFQLHGGNQAITDLEILNSTYGVLFSHADWTGIKWDAGARIRLVGSNLGGRGFYGDSSVNIFIDSCTIETTNFHLGDHSTATLLNSTVTNNGNNPVMTFFIGKNSTFVSAKDTVRSFADLHFTTSGSQLNGNVYGGSFAAVLNFLQEDPANPLPNIINGNLSAGEINTTIGISGDLKISGNISGFSDYAVGSSTPVLVDGQEVFGMGGITNYGGTTAINNCMNDFCHFTLELFGNTNSRITWNTGFPVDTLIINKTGCAKVTIDSALYVSGATRIESGQLVLNPNDDHPYKFVCAGNVDIAQGGGLFLRKDANGVVANMAVEGTLVDHNASADSTCAGLSNPYNGIISLVTSALPDSLFNFIGSYQNKTVILSWSTLGKINTKYFTLEKSFDQVTFLPLGNITASGNPGESNYQFTDLSSLKAMNYYRLKIVNADSLFTYGKIIAVAAPVSDKIIIFPNPAKDKITIRLGNVSEKTDIVIADARGMIVKKLQLMAGIVETSVNIPDLQPGVYSISFQSGQTKSIQQFVKL